jgi:hypothetical protein
MEFIESFFDSLVKGLGKPPESPLGSKPTLSVELSARRVEAARLTSLLETYPTFSFVRLGDMDLGLLLAAQNGLKENESPFSSGVATGTASAGCPGISVGKAARLKEALERADYVDFHERLWPVGPLLPQLQLNRDSALYRNPDPQSSYLLLTWMEHEFKGYCERHVVGFCGAEAAVLENLCTCDIFRQHANIWPNNIRCFFHQPLHNGANLDIHLDELKKHLIDFVDRKGIDTLFLSLGGAAKILCYEIAREVGIRCIDFGAMLRSLCYLGSDGDRGSRSTHSPYYYRLPFYLVMQAVEKSFPELTPEVLLSKAHAQVILDLQKKENGWTSANSELDLSVEARRRFRESYRQYLAQYKSLFRLNNVTRLERKRFLHFCGKHRLTLSGRWFYLWFVFKSRLTSLVRYRF